MKWWHVLMRLCHSNKFNFGYCVTVDVFAFRFFFFCFTFILILLLRLSFVFSSRAHARSHTRTAYQKCNEHYSPFVCLVFDLLHSKTIQHKHQWNKLQSVCMLVYTINQHNCIEHPNCQNDKMNRKKKIQCKHKKPQISSFVRFFFIYRCSYDFFPHSSSNKSEKFIFWMCDEIGFQMLYVHVQCILFLNKPLCKWTITTTKSPECILNCFVTVKSSTARKRKTSTEIQILSLR